MLVCNSTRAQFVDSSTGLMQMPTADMQENGTFMITNNYLNKHSTSPHAWGYSTFAYGFNITFWSRLEVGYVCTIFDSTKRLDYKEGDHIMHNQDRHFLGRFQLLKEGEFGAQWIPSLVVGISDPSTGSGSGGYTNTSAVSGRGNGYFNRMYIVATKHFNTEFGNIGAHLGWQYNRRTDYPLNGPCVGLNWKPVWIENFLFVDYVNLMAEYDARTFNLGFVASVWDNRFEAMFELQNLSWLNFGLRYKLRLR